MSLADYAESVDAVLCCRKVAEVFDLFREGREVVVVIDETCAPLGLLRESDLKKYVYASFGRELIRNKPLSYFIFPCECLDVGLDIDSVLRSVERGFPAEGFIVTREGRYAGMLKKDALLRLYERNRKESEKQILQLQRIESLGTLAGGIAHELNNMLMPIIGNAEIGVEESREGTKAHRAFSRILSAAMRSAEIVGKILIFSRPDISEKEPLNPAGAVGELVGLLEASLPSTIRVVTAVNDAEGIVCADSTQFSQVLLNLCTNAAHAMKNCGDLVIEVDSVNIPEAAGGVGVRRAGEYMRISVTDSGTGIPDEIRSRMFDPFFTTKEVGQGTGLGLSVVLGIVKNHGGFIEVESEQGRGSTFRVHWPRCGTGKVYVAREERQVPTGTSNILLVDDEAQIINVAGEYLSRLGYRIVATTSSDHALDIFKASPHAFDLLLTDQTMPNMTGAELISKVQALRPDLPVVLCSGNASLTLDLEAHAEEIDVFLQKPVPLAELAVAVSRALTREGQTLNAGG